MPVGRHNPPPFPDVLELREYAATGRHKQDDDTKMSFEARLQTGFKTRPPTAEDGLSNLYKRELDIIGDVKITLEVFKGLIVRVKTDGVKDSVGKLTVQFDSLLRSREDIKSECRTEIAGERFRADALAVDSKIADQVTTSETKILNALETVSERLDNHDALIASLVDHGAASQTQKSKTGGEDKAEKWTEVVKNRSRRSIRPSLFNRGRELHMRALQDPCLRLLWSNAVSCPSSK